MPRGNKKNLVDNDSLTPEERRERARKAGIASGKARQERKTMAEAIKLALQQEIDGKSVQDTGITALLAKMMDGDVRAFEVVRDTIGEKPTDKTALDATVSMSDAERKLLEKVAKRLT